MNYINKYKVKKMEDTIQRIKDFIREEAEEFYNSEMNYNNCDPTTHMKCFSEVSDVEKEIIRLLSKND